MIRQAERLAEWQRLRLADPQQKTPATIDQKAAKEMDEDTWILSSVWGKIITDREFLAAIACKRKLVKTAADLYLSTPDFRYKLNNGYYIDPAGLGPIVQEPAAVHGQHTRSI